MSSRQIVVLIGVLVLVIGFLTPIQKEKGEGDYEYLYAPSGHSFLAVLLLLVIVSVLVFTEKDDLAWFFGLMVLGILINDFRVDAKQTSDSDYLELSWGWAVLVAGALTIAGTAFLGKDLTQIVGFLSGGGRRRYQQYQQYQQYPPYQQYPQQQQYPQSQYPQYPQQPQQPPQQQPPPQDHWRQ
jgi:hypothetical protein